MTPAEQTAQAVRIIVVLLVLAIVAGGGYLYVHHANARNAHKQDCLDRLTHSVDVVTDCPPGSY